MRKASPRKKSAAKARRSEPYFCCECRKEIVGPVMHYGGPVSSTNAYCRLCFNP